MKRVTLTLLSTLLSVCAASAARADVGDNAVGMNTHVPTQSLLDACSDLGVGWVRMDANWFWLEPADNQYAWQRLDPMVDAAHAAGFEVFLTLGYTPDWAADRGDTDGFGGNDVPTDSTKWEEFVQDAVTHYRAKGVRHFGMWNEANLDHFWEGNAQQYADVIATPGAAAVRSACADCLVLGPELANIGDADDWLEDILRAVPAGTFDIITHHIYPGFPETGQTIFDGDNFRNVLDDQRFAWTRRSIRQVLDSVGYTGEVWITETGETASAGDVDEEDRQATYIELVLDEQLARDWYTNTIFYEIQDCGPDLPNCGTDGFGLIRPQSGTPGQRQFPADYHLKSAFTTLQSYIGQHPEFGASPPPQPGADTGAPDAGAPDGGADDAGGTDAAGADAGVIDTGAYDAGTLDASSDDAHIPSVDVGADVGASDLSTPPSPADSGERTVGDGGASSAAAASGAACQQASGSTLPASPVLVLAGLALLALVRQSLLLDDNRHVRI